MSLGETAVAEVGALHDFFEAWFRGDRSRTAGVARLEQALATDFQLIAPDGSVSGREAVVEAVAGRHGANGDDEPPFRILVDAVEPRFEAGDGCLVTYEEHQRTAGDWRGRRSSAWFQRHPAAPGGVVWRHLHETWLDG